MSLSFSIKDWSMWQADASEVAPNVKDLPMMLRRRLSRLGKIAMRVAHDIKDEKAVLLVFSSRYGESAQTIKLLLALADKEPLSPAGFSMSVHNGLAGLLSIATKNTQNHTAISAGPSSFSHGLLEAVCLLQNENTDGVLLVHYDEPLPEFYGPFHDEAFPTAGLALYLEKPNAGSLILSVSSAQGEASPEEDAISFAESVLQKNDNWSWTDSRTCWTIKNAS